MKTKKFLKITGFIISLFIITFLIFTAWYFVATKDTFFDESKIGRYTPVCEVYDYSGKIISTNGNNSYVKIEELQEYTKNAFIAVEDKRFYSHNGIDYLGIARAMKNNLLSGKIKEGGSTISQQYIKNTFLSGEKTVNRKLKEIKLTKILENNYTKDEILEMYLNSIYFGEGAYGIESASKTYFNKNAKNLTIEESATLAGIVKAPTLYNPFDYYDKCFKRRNLVLSLMKEQNYITTEQERIAKISEISVKNTRNYEDNSTVLDKVYKDAVKALNVSSTADLSGYKIYTSYQEKVSNYFYFPKDYGINCDMTAMIVDN
ncbi:MAG: penicillin-binding protein, partial [Clostridia bacterium]|nr:penicillin-binding protein [Clostridia bacterium]